MKHLLLLLALVATAAHAQTTATPRELHLRTDIDADGRNDIVVIERAGGTFRIGYQTVPGQITWSSSRASGAAGASWATSGDLSGVPGSLAIAAPETNVVSVCAAPSPNSAVVPILVHPNGVGPLGVVATDIGGAGNTADDDLIIFTHANDLPSAHRRELVRHTGGGADSYAPHGQQTGTAFRASNRVVAKDGGNFLVGVLEGSDDTATFRLFDTASGVLVETASTGALHGSGFLSGRFGAGEFHQFFFWKWGDTDLVWRPSAAQGVDGVQFLAGDSFDVGRPIGEIVLLSGGAATRLLVVSADGETAAVFDFDGSIATLADEMTAPNGSTFTGAFARADGAFTLLSGTPGTGLSSDWQEWEVDGDRYSPGASGSLPSHMPAGTRANVFLFATEPFVVPDPGLIASLNAPEWSSDVTINAVSLSATTEVYSAEASGLGSAAAHPLGTPPNGVSFALGNQLRTDTSLGSFQDVLGAADLEVDISPPSGTFTTAVTPNVSGTAGAEVFARVGNGPWTPAASFNPRLTADATIQAYAQVVGSTRKTPIHSAHYLFTVEPNLVDSDKDGVPDFVEATATPNPPLDPNSGQDVDKDGYSDLEEWLAGTDPLDKLDFPVDAMGEPAKHLANSGSFILRGALQPLDGTTGQRTDAATDVVAEIFTPEGKRLGSGATQFFVPGFLGEPAFEMERLTSSSALVSLLSQAVYDIDTADDDKGRGRELAALVAVPRVPLPEIDYVPGGGTTTQEVAAWKAAAQAAVTASQPVIVPVSPNEQHVLTALLFEKWLNGVALDRALAGVTAENVSIFPSRPTEAGRRALTAKETADLSQRLSDVLPGWDVLKVLAALEFAALPPAQTLLTAVASDIYQTSSLLGVGENAPDYLPPFDVLRGFVRTGGLPAAYAAASAVSQADRDAAFQSIAPLLASLMSRPVETIDLEVTDTSFDGACPVLQRVGSVELVGLYQRSDLPYPFADSFTLMPGVQLRVTGHTDLIEPDCPGLAMEVLEVAVTSIPALVQEDLDMNLLEDAWEGFFFLGGSDPLEDSDGDGFDNLQELLDGTDPLLPGSKGDVPMDLSPPEIEFTLMNDDELIIEWDYPEAYADKIIFTLNCSDNLKEYDPIVLKAKHVNGHFTVTLPMPEGDQKFYQVLITLAN